MSSIRQYDIVSGFGLLGHALRHQKVSMNDLSDDIKGAITVAAFKYRLNRNVKILPKHFNAASRKGHFTRPPAYGV